MNIHRNGNRYLRQENRILRLAVLLQSFGMIGWLCMGTSPVHGPEDVIRAERFEIVDPTTGAVTVAIGADEKGRPSVQLVQPNGCPSVTLKAYAEGGRLTCFNSDNVRSIDVAAISDGGVIGIRDCDGPRITMGTNGDGSVGIALVGAGELAVQLTGDPLGGQINVLRGGENAVVVGTNRMGGHLMLYSDTGKPVVCLERHTKHHRGTVYLYGEDDRRAGCLTLDDQSRPTTTSLIRKEE